MAIPEGYTPLAKIGINYKGEYVSGTTYSQLDAVYYNGSTYLALIDNPAGAPNSDGVNWRFLARGMVEQIIETYSDLMANTVAGYVPDAQAVKEGFENLTFTNYEQVKYGGDEIYEWEYTATKFCEVHFGFLIPLGKAIGIVIVNGSTITIMGNSWEENTERHIVPYSVILQKGDVLRFYNHPNETSFTSKVSPYIITIRS